MDVQSPGKTPLSLAQVSFEVEEARFQILTRFADMAILLQRAPILVKLRMSAERHRVDDTMRTIDMTRAVLRAENRSRIETTRIPGVSGALDVTSTLSRSSKAHQKSRYGAGACDPDHTQHERVMGGILFVAYV